MKSHFDTPTLITILITLVLFIAALFTKGFTHDLLLEAGVFLVSVKLILMGYRNSVAVNTILEEIRISREALLKPLRHCADAKDEEEDSTLQRSEVQ